MTYFYVFLGGGLGSLARYIISKFSARVIPMDFPIGTLIANLVACILLALLVVGFSNKQADFQWIQPLLIIGFCGGFSTFSTFSNETFALIDGGHIGLALLNVAISIIAGIGLIFLIRIKG